MINRYIHNLYGNILNNICIKNNINDVISFNNTLNLVNNSIFVAMFNYKFAIIKLRNICKKNCLNLEGIITSKDSLNIIVPIVCYPENNEMCDKYISAIRLIKSSLYPKYICVSILFGFINKGYGTLFVDKLNELSCKKTSILIEICIGLDEYINYSSDILGYSEKQILDKYLLYNKITNNVRSSIDDIRSSNLLFKMFKKIRDEKKTKICISIGNINNIEEVIKYCNILGPYIACIKINSNFIYNINIISGLRKLADFHRFIIIDDKKIVINTTDQFNSLIPIFNIVDAISVSLEINDINIEQKLLELLNTSRIGDKYMYEKGIILNYTNNLKLIRHQSIRYNKYIFGVIGGSDNIENINSILEYKHFKNNIKHLKCVDIIVIGEELYQQRNPLEIVKKINKICFDN